MVAYFCMYVSVFMALITTLVLCARSQDFVMSVSVRRLHVVLSTAGFKGEGKPCRKTRETAALRIGFQNTSRNLPGSNPSHRCASSGPLPIQLPERPRIFVKLLPEFTEPVLRQSLILFFLRTSYSNLRKRNSSQILGSFLLQD